MPGKNPVYALSSLRTNLIVTLCFILFISLFTFAEPIELTLRNGTNWNGKIGDRVEVVTRSGRKSESINGLLLRKTKNAIVVEFNSRSKPIIINSIESIITLAVSDDLQIIKNNDDKEIATPSIEIDLSKLFWFFRKGYRFDYFRQISQPMIQPSINRYAVIDLSGTFGVIEKSVNRTYSPLFITPCTLKGALINISKEKRKIRHVVFKIDSTGGDKGAIHNVGLLLDEYRTHFTYHAVVVNASPELNPLFVKFANIYSLSSKGAYVAPISVSSISDIGKKLGLQEWVEIERVSSNADSARLVLRKHILDFMAKEEKLFLSILRDKNILEQASLVLDGIEDTYYRILEEEKRFLDSSIYEKQMESCFEELVDSYVSYETGFFSHEGKRAWDSNMSSLSAAWRDCCELVNHSGTNMKKFKQLENKIEVQKKKYHKTFNCITVTHQIMRNDYIDKINLQVFSVLYELESKISRLVNHSIQPCFKANHVLSRRGNYPWYYVKPPCSAQKRSFIPAGGGGGGGGGGSSGGGGSGGGWGHGAF